MVRITRAAAAAAALAAGAATPLKAQIDYRNLDRERPVATEDAYPVERHAVELLLPLRTGREQGGDRLHLMPLELEYGVLDNTQITVALPLAAHDPADADTEWGLAGLGLSALYNFNTESPRLPALSLGADLALPVGSLAGEDARVSLRAVGTRSWGLTRAHLNVVRSFGAEDEPGPASAPRWSWGVALDRTLFRESLLLVGELVVRRPLRRAPTEANVGLGVRWQLSPTFVLDLGLARRLRADAGPDYDLTAGLSHVFGLPWLVPDPAR